MFPLPPPNPCLQPCGGPPAACLRAYGGSIPVSTSKHRLFPNPKPDKPNLCLQNKQLIDKVQQLADKKGCSLGQLALSWVHHQGEDVFPIPGTKRIKYLEENIAAFDVKLSKEDLAWLDENVPHDQVCCSNILCPRCVYSRPDVLQENILLFCLLVLMLIF